MSENDGSLQVFPTIVNLVIGLDPQSERDDGSEHQISQPLLANKFSISTKASDLGIRKDFPKPTLASLFVLRF